jgi:hypothetical protein
VTDVLVRETVTRNAALGIRFWDTAEATALVDGLDVELFAPANPAKRRRCVPNRSAVYVAHAVPGLHDYEYGFEGAPGASPPQALRRRIEMTDPAGRFLPIAFDADLPHRGIFSFAAPWLSPPQAVTLPTEAGSPPLALVERIPLFSAPARPVPDPLGVAYAQLRDDATRKPVAWCLLGVTIDGVMRGLGLSDIEGRVAVMFPFPEPPRRAISSPPAAHDDFAWEVTLTAFRSWVSPPAEPPGIPDLAQVLESLDSPATVITTRNPPGTPFRLGYRQPLTARTAGGAGEDAAYLFVSA